MKVSRETKQRIDKTCAKLDGWIAFCFKKVKEDAAKRIGWSFLLLVLCGMAWALSWVFPGTKQLANHFLVQAFPILAGRGAKSPQPEIPKKVRPVVPHMVVTRDIGRNLFGDYRSDRSRDVQMTVNPPELAAAAKAVATSVGTGEHPAVSWKGNATGDATVSFPTDPQIGVVKLQVSAREDGRSYGAPVDIPIHDEYSVQWMKCFTEGCELPDKICTGEFQVITEGSMLQAPNQIDTMPVWFFYFLAQFRSNSVVQVALDDGLVAVFDLQKQKIKLTAGGTRLKPSSGSEEFSIRRLGGGEQSFFIGKDQTSVVVGIMVDGPSQILVRYPLPSDVIKSSRSTVSLSAVRGDFSLAGVAFSGFPTYLGSSPIPETS